MCYLYTVGRPVGRSTWSRPALFIVGALVAVLALQSRASAARRAPAWVPVDSAPAAETRLVGAVRWIETRDAPARLVPDTVPPDEPVRLLWLEGRVTQPTHRGQLVVDPEAGILEFDARLTAHRRRADLDGREPATVAAAANDGLWVTTLDGTTLRLGASGRGEEVVAGPFAHTTVASDPSGAAAWLVRSSARFAYHLDTAAPLLARLEGGSSTGVGRSIVPDHSLLIDLANAGSVAVSRDAVFYAPFIRDEVVAMRHTGDTLWVASRGLPQATSQPRFELDRGKPVVNYHPVNLGAALGPDGNLYVLSTPGFTTSSSRLDVFDPATGTMLRTARIPETALPTLAVAASGRVYLMDAARLLARVAARAGDLLPAISLPTLTGGSAPLAERGRITLINVWASWCGPCREELPALDSLRRALAAEPMFRFVTVSEDLRLADAKRFMDALAFDFPVLHGAGRMKQQLRYPGLPYTVLVSADGRVARKWIGYAGAVQVDSISAAIRRLVRSAGSAHSHH